MDFIQEYGKEIVSALSSTLIFLSKRFGKPKARMTYAFPHAYTYLVQQPLNDSEGKQISPTQVAHVASIRVQNAGSEALTNVELVFNWEPLCLNVWPQRNAIFTTLPDKRYVVQFLSLAPKEVVNCELLSINANLPDLLQTRADQCVPEKIELAPQPIATPLMIRAVLVTSFLGFAVSVYLILMLLQFIVLRTPPLGH